jgi:hypothetical protein
MDNLPEPSFLALRLATGFFCPNATEAVTFHCCEVHRDEFSRCLKVLMSASHQAVAAQTSEKQRFVLIY